MHRIDTPTAQKDKFGAGKNGFTRGNPQTGVPVTDLDDDYFDAIQEELAGVVEAGGLTLDKEDRGQVLKALKILFAANSDALGALAALIGAANKLPYFTGPEAASLTDLTLVGRNIIGKTTTAEVLTYLGLGGVTSLREATFTASTTWTCPAGVTSISVDGAGAGGGAAYGGAGGLGGGGAQSVKGTVLNVVPSQVYTITIGAGGIGGTSATLVGSDGGVTSLGSLLTLAGGAGSNGFIKISW